MRAVYIAIVTFVIAMIPPAAAAQRAPIKVGITAAMSGPARSLGLGMRTGIQAYFNRVNFDGGVKGRQIELVALDDGYVPDAAKRNMDLLVADEQVIAILGNVGTPTAQVTVPIAIREKTLLFGAFTGASLLRETPPSRYVINFRASYAQETSAMVRGLLAQGILPYQIAVFSQNDGYGDAGYEGVVRSLEEAGYRKAREIPHGRYERNTVDVEHGLLTILEAPVQPRAIIMIGAYAACAQFIRMARRTLAETLYLNVSFVGSTALVNALGEDGEGVIITQVVPHFESDTPIVKEYLVDLAEYVPTEEPGFVSLEGYVVARLFVEALRSAGEPVNRESVIEALLSMRDRRVGLGIPVTFKGPVHQASTQVWPTVIRKGRIEPFEFDSLRTGANRRDVTRTDAVGR